MERFKYIKKQDNETPQETEARLANNRKYEEQKRQDYKSNAAEFRQQMGGSLSAMIERTYNNSVVSVD